MRQRLASVPLTEICSLITDGTHDSPKLQESGVPFIKGKNINTGRIDFTNCDFISEEDHEKCIKRVKPQADDILLANIGASIGDCAKVVVGPEFSIKNVALLRPDPQKVDPSYFFHYVKGVQFQGKLLNQRLGAAQPYVSLQSFRSLSVDILPSRESQKRIGGIADSYDDLIENNRRRIQLLEQAARLLYKEWFVNLRFPGHEHVKVKDGVPEGWERKRLGDVCHEVRETVSPEKLEPDTSYIGLEHMPRRSISLNEWGTADQVTSSKHRFEERDILFGKIRPYFHKVGVAFTSGVASSDAIVIRPVAERFMPLVLLTASSDNFVAVTSKTMKEGSKMPRADWKQMKQYLTPFPPDSLLAMFNEMVEPIVGQLKVLSFENRKLAVARDLLLPRLMSGVLGL